MFNWSTYQKPTIVLSPMSGYTDSAYKQIVRHCSKEVVLITEFVSTDALFYQSPKTLRMMAFAASEHPVILQVFGKRPERFVHAARIAEAMGYDGVDINMGCPAKKVISSDHGSALVKIENRHTAYKIVEKMAKAVSIPISVKTRLGWENADELVEFCQQLESHGCASLCVHGRTSKQGYRGDADWKSIYDLKRKVSIPVFGNGDITTVSAFRHKIKNLDGVFVARASFGDPWILSDIIEYSKHREKYDRLSDEDLDILFPRAAQIQWSKKKDIVLMHAELSVQTKGEVLGILEMRKHLAAYVKGLPRAKELREKLIRVETLDELKTIVKTID